MDIKPFKHILVVVGSDEDPSIPLARAIRLCEAHSGKMSVFISMHKAISEKRHQDTPDDLTLLVNKQRESITGQLDKLSGGEYLDDIIISSQHKPSIAVAKLLETASFDLVLKAPYQQSEFKGLFRSGLDHYFVSDCALPVWMVKPRLWDSQIEVLACVDMGDDDFDNHALNRKILSTSDHISGLLDAQMHVVDCFYGEIGTMRIDYNDKRGFKREATIKQQHIEKLKLYISEYALSDDVLHFEQGIPDDAIPNKAASLNAELAVIGNNEDTNFIDKIFGDTAMILAKAMPCDILVLKPNTQP